MDRSDALSALLVAGCAGAEPTDPFADVQRADIVISAPGETGEGHKDAQYAINGVHGGGSRAGSLDVYSLSLDETDELILAFPEPLVDGEGPDLAVFENPFVVAGGGNFMDPLVVEISSDGSSFVAFPHAYSRTTYSTDPSEWSGFAGISPVILHEEDHLVAPLSEEAGGDRFDLADLEEIPEGVRYVRLTSAIHWRNPETDAPFPRDPISDGPDIDGVYGRLP